MRNRKEKNIFCIAVLLLVAALLAGCGAKKAAEGTPENVREAAQEDGKTADANTAEKAEQAAAESIDVTEGGEEDGVIDPDAVYTEAEYICDLKEEWITGPYINMDMAPYIVHVDSKAGKDTVFDRNGKELFHTGYGDEEEGHYWTLFDNEVLALENNTGPFEGTVTLFDPKGNVLLETAYDGSNYFYADGIFYHMAGTKDDNPRKVAAYDLKAGKELWETEGDHPILMENGFLALMQSQYSDYWDVVVNSKTGELYCCSAEGGRCLISEGAAAGKSKDRLDVYDYNRNLTVSYPYQEGDGVSEYCFRLLDTGAFVIGNRNSDTYKIYSKEGNLITVIETEYFKNYPEFPYAMNKGWGTSKKERQKQLSSSYAILQDREDCCYCFYDDDTWTMIGEVLDDEPELQYGCIAAYLPEEHKSLEELTVKIVNMRTKQEHEFAEPVDTDFEVSEGYTYYIFRGSFKSGAKEYYVYDKDFNLIYETEAHLEPVNNRCFLEADEDKLTLIDIETMERHPLNTEGKFSDCSETHLTTRGEEGIKHVYRLK